MGGTTYLVNGVVDSNTAVPAAGAGATPSSEASPQS